MNMDRRRFLRFGAGAVAVAALPIGGCAVDDAPAIERATGKLALDVYGTRYEVLPEQHTVKTSRGGVAKGPRIVNYPVAVAVTEDRAYVVECGNHRVQIFDDAAKSLGFLDGELSYPGGIAAVDGEIWVADSRAGRLVRYADGKQVSAIGGLSAPRGIALYGSQILVADPGLRQVLILTRDGRVVDRVGTDWVLPYDVATDGRRVFVADASAPAIAMFDGNARRDLALQAAPRFVSYGIDGTLYVG